MSPYGVVTEAGTVRFERILPGPIERVWAYLTEPAKRATWFAGGPMELRRDGRIELVFRHANLSRPDEIVPEKYRQAAEGVTMLGRITACEPPRLLGFTWGDEPTGQSEVTFELAPRGDGDVLLVLTHRRLATHDEMRDVAGGWHLHLDILAARLNLAAPPPFWSTHAALEAEYRRRIGA